MVPEQAARTSLPKMVLKGKRFRACSKSRGRRWDPAEGIGILQNCVEILKMSIGKYVYVILLNSA